MTLPKPKNIELQQGIHNPPDQLFLRFGRIILYSDNLFLTPIVQTTYIRTTKTYETVYEWAEYNADLHDSKILYDKRVELIDIINNFVDYLSLSVDDRKELFRLYKETQLAKLDEAIDGLQKAIPLIWNEEIRLPDIYFKIDTTIKVYTTVLSNLKKRQTGYHQLLYDMLMPLLYKLREYGFSDYKAKPLISDLLERFGYSRKDVGKELIRYEKKEYFPDNVISQINNHLNQ